MTCDEFKEKFPQYDLDNKGDCANGKGKWSDYVNDAPIDWSCKHHLDSDNCHLLSECLKVNDNHTVKIRSCESKCQTECYKKYESDREKLGVSEDSQKIDEDHTECLKNCPTLETNPR